MRKSNFTPRVYRVSELIDIEILDIGDGYRAKNSEMSNEGLPFARAGNINDGFHFESADWLGHDGVVRAAEKISKPGDVLFTSKGTVGRFALVKEETPQFVYSPQLCYWRSKEHSILYPEFLYYWMSSPGFISQINSVKGQTDMADYVNLRDQRMMYIQIPPLSHQQKIATILSSLDNKIELNRQMNRTLEQMARALFKSWFIDFDPVYAKQRGEKPEGMDAEIAALFPNRFVEIDEKEVPEGWSITSIEELAESIFSGGTPDTRKPEYWNGSIPWFSSGETRNSFIIKTEKTITPAGLENSSTRPIRKKDILVASAGQGFTRGQTSFNMIDAYINQSVVAIRTNLRKVSPEWLYINISGRYEEMRGLSDGHSSRGSLTTKIIAQMPVALAPQKITGAYTAIVEGLIERQVNNMREIDQLASLRDSLLPRLLSGELDVSDWETAVEAAEATFA